jgi:hypothetical protein
MALCRCDIQGISGIVLIVVFINVMINSIAFSPSCNWSQETTIKQCFVNRSNTITKLSEVVELEYCFQIPYEDTFSFYNPWQVAFPVNWQPQDICKRYGCSGGCLKMTTPCVEGAPDNIETNYECVAAQNGQDMRPLAVFLYPPFIIMGVLLVFLTKDFSYAQLLAIWILAFGVFTFERSINIIRGCPWANETYRGCGTGQNGEIKNEKTVILEMCSSNAFYEHTPFATNLRNSEDCLQFGCSTSQCLQHTTLCPNNVGDNYQCVDQVAEASASPLSLFYSLALIALGIVLCCFKGKNEHQRLLDN